MTMPDPVLDEKSKDTLLEQHREDIRALQEMVDRLSEENIELGAKAERYRVALAGVQRALDDAGKARYVSRDRIESALQTLPDRLRDEVEGSADA